ncbi:peptidylprolyl isomerase [Pararhizobium mangrovi]|uniref:Peptidyl-prolyl cis-trans isomerase n=2 Tax=Pararhizobium mangrovi TaxID=2590452 RepID=A0A506UF14_9HYPH|nr:peptidylprolyl isomerase [Pararhizobium mangrovi]TPW31389.1 peptidylprolyl isomerase [Pararhizobium mangrovi]
MLVTAPGMAANAKAAGDRMTIHLKQGNVVVQLMPKLAPKAVERLETLAEKGAYDNVAFHRVIDGFMAQTGDVKYGDMKDGYDPQRVGTGGSSMSDLPAEFTDTPFVRGTVGMARAQDPDSANSQFFIMFAPAPSLDGKYTVVGKVVDGMDVVDHIKRGAMSDNGKVDDPDRMLSVTIDDGSSDSSGK